LNPLGWLGQGYLHARRPHATCALSIGGCGRQIRRADFFTIETSLFTNRSRFSFMLGVSTYSAVQICGPFLTIRTARDGQNVFLLRIEKKSPIP
jgi:hypothetical protein